MSWLASLVGGAVALAAASRLRWLTPSGVFAAAIVGLAILAGTGGFGVALVLLFFLTSAALTRFGSARKPRPTHAGGRSSRQVLANGGVAAALSLMALAGWVPAAHYAFVGAVAAATADTWATEIGTYCGWPTWSVIGEGRVAPGRSGGISIPGTLAGIFGAALIGVAADVLVRSSAVPAVASGGSWVLSACLAGTAGMFADSLLGATLEDRWGLLGNDEVNLGCTLVGATAGWALGSVGG